MVDEGGGRRADGGRGGGERIRGFAAVRLFRGTTRPQPKLRPTPSSRSPFTPEAMRSMFFGLLAAGAAASTNLTVDGSHSLAAGVHTFEVLHVTATGTLTINGVVEIIASVVEVESGGSIEGSRPSTCALSKW